MIYMHFIIITGYKFQSRIDTCASSTQLETKIPCRNYRRGRAPFRSDIRRTLDASYVSCLSRLSRPYLHTWTSAVRYVRVSRTAPMSCSRTRYSLSLNNLLLTCRGNPLATLYTEIYRPLQSFRSSMCCTPDGECRLPCSMQASIFVPCFDDIHYCARHRS